MPLLDLLWPDHCVLCRMPLLPRLKHLLCAYCWQDLPWLTAPCRHCALPLTQPGVCGTCQNDPLTRGRAVIPMIHIEEAQYLIHRFKFNRGMREGQTLSHTMLFGVFINYQGDVLPQALVAVPLSAINQAHRGYNQAAILAESLGKALRIPVLYPFRRRHGAAQRTLSKQQREKLNQHAFKQRKPVPYQHVAVVDDVLTTGSTVRAMAAALHRSGVKQVDVWCATRAVATVGHVRAI